jgi:hypothetical protein
MKTQPDRKPREVVGHVSTDTRGPPGVFMEGGGLWNGQHLTD